MATAANQGVWVFASELGWMALAWRDQHLVRLTFGYPSAAAAAAAVEADEHVESRSAAGPERSAGGPTPPKWIVQLVERLQSYAAGNEERFDDVPLDFTHLSAFQTRVVRACRRIGRGKVRTYAEVARAAGSPGAARAVGNVMAANRYPIIVPCHRVVGSAGSLGGFSAIDGTRTKRRMLEMEGAKLPVRKKAVCA